MHVLHKKEKYYWIFLACLITSVFMVQTSWAQQESNSFEDLLKDVILESPMPITGVFNFYTPNTGWNPPVPGFVPINGLNDANAVPFLINVMENGPDWADEDLPEGKGDMYRYVARCYASLCLGTTKDYRAFDPLVEIMNNTAIEQYYYEINVVRQVTYNLRRNAAFAIGYLDDYNAVEPLMERMEQDGFIECIYSLVRLRAAEAAPSIIKIASDYGLFNTDIHLGLEYILRVNFEIYSEEDVYGIKEFPEVGKKPYNEIYSTLWQHWLKVGDEYAKDQFEEYYPQWKAALEEKPDANSLHEALLERMTKGGVAAIPHIMRKIEQGDADLVQAISNLTGEHQLRYFTASQCLQWWSENKQKWLIFTPIPETLNVPLDYPNIQAAIDDANDEDIIIVADGTYTGNGNRDIDFKGKAITVKSENGPETCIIDCQGTEDEPHRGFYFHNNEDENSILQGFTITNGYSLSGGGIYCFMCSPKIVDCIITKNISDYGGGLETSSSKSTINDCIISNNYAYISGGGIFTTFRPDINIDGPFFKNCIISGNRSNEYGGGILCSRSSTIINCTIFGNMSSGNGGGIYIMGIFDDVVNLHNCILWGNTSSTGNGNQIYSSTSTRGYVTIIAKYCSIQNNLHDLSIPSGYMLGNWISEDPNFANQGYWDSNSTIDNMNDDFWIEGDYHLKSQAGRFDPNTQSWVQDDVTSPCIDAGDPNSPIGYEPFPNGGRINMGAYGGTTEASKSYFGKPVCTTIVAGDINGDCKVDVLDFEIMLLHWLEEH